ncbi:MAG TPA: hemerythrin domain-containing protein [Solirubrobacteraceae bacterium]|jgi:hemerythrin-like domain-containing protein
MANAFEILGRDHEEVKRMLSELELGPTAATGANADQLALRKKMVQQLVIEESKHEAVEEMYFWPIVRTRLTGGDGVADEAQNQEQEGKSVLDQLDKLSPEDADFEAQLSAFIRAGREHIAFEETTVWPSLRASLSAQEADDLGRKLEEGKKTAPTRPHPHTPASPGVLKTAGPAVAAADRLRDAVTGRDGRDE